MNADSPFSRHSVRFTCFFNVRERKGTEPGVRAPGLVLGDHELSSTFQRERKAKKRKFLDY